MSGVKWLKNGAPGNDKTAKFNESMADGSTKMDGRPSSIRSGSITTNYAQSDLKSCLMVVCSAKYSGLEPPTNLAVQVSWP